MTELVLPLYILAALFAVVAFFYSSVGLGGGSAYTALLAIAGATPDEIPLISLILNLLVTTIGAVIFLVNGHARMRLIAPFLVSSIPAAYLGGMVQLPKIIFYIILIISLFFAVFRIYSVKKARTIDLNRALKLLLAIVSGFLLGFVAGVTGIGGGIYLVPLIIILGLGSAKEAAACGAFFIWVNSASGLLARLQYSSVDVYSFLPLILAVMIGSLAGAAMGAGRFPLERMQKILGSILVVAIVLLSRKVFSLLV